MKDPTEFLNSFPEVRELIENTKRQIKAIDEQIKNLRHDQPKPHLKPSGTPPVRTQENYYQEKIRLETVKQKVIEQSYKDINNILTHVEEDKKEAINSYIKDQFAPPKDNEKERGLSLADKLIATLPSEKIKQFKDNADILEKTQKDSSKNLSNAERLMESLPSSRLEKEFKDNNPDMTKDMDRESYEPELD